MFSLIMLLALIVFFIFPDSRSIFNGTVIIVILRAESLMVDLINSQIQTVNTLRRINKKLPKKE